MYVSMLQRLILSVRIRPHGVVNWAVEGFLSLAVTRRRMSGDAVQAVDVCGCPSKVSQPLNVSGSIPASIT